MLSSLKHFEAEKSMFKFLILSLLCGANDIFFPSYLSQKHFPPIIYSSILCTYSSQEQSALLTLITDFKNCIQKLVLEYNSDNTTCCGFAKTFKSKDYTELYLLNRFCIILPILSRFLYIRVLWQWWKWYVIWQGK